MRIATEVKGYLTVPAPPDIVYAPYDLAYALSNGLAENGHSVDFFAPEGSDAGAARVETLGLDPLAQNYRQYMDLLFNTAYHSDNVLALQDQFYAEEMFRRARDGRYDVLHFHHPEVALPFVRANPDVPVVYTMHDPIDALQKSILERYRTPNQGLVSVSDFQRLAAPDLPYIATVYNGINTDEFRSDPQVPRDDRLLMVARIVPEKGAKEAVQVALETNRKLDIIGPVFESSREYFDTHVRPHLGDQIRYLGHIARKNLPLHFQRAAAFLMPIDWDEPFGVTMTEAMACGTPVVAFRRGSVPEVVAHEETGFVVDTIDEMIAAVQEIGEISPAACRQRVLTKFSIAAMVRGYEAVYRQAMQNAF